jgi:hypothetical protein
MRKAIWLGTTAILVFMLVLVALFTTACGQTTVVREVVVTAQPEVIVVTATPAPEPEIAAPKADIPPATREYLLGLGFRGPSIDETGSNSCDAEYCIHYNRGSMAFSHYYNHGQLTGIVLSHTMGTEDGEFGEYAANVFYKSGIPQDAIDAIGTLLQKRGGRMSVSSGWDAVVLDQDGRLYLALVIPNKNVGASHSGDPV